MDDAYSIRYLCRYCEATFDSKFQVGPSTIFAKNWHSCSFCGHVNGLPDGRAEDIKKSEPEERSPRKLNYPQVPPDNEDLEKLLSGVSTRQLLGPLSAFCSNIHRLRSLQNLPILAMGSISLIQRRICEAQIEVMGSIDGVPESEEQIRLIEKRASELFNSWIKQVGTEHATAASQDYGVLGLETLMQIGSGQAWLGLGAILIAQITGMWTAFETLAGDLWETAVNTNPWELSALKGKPFKDSKKKRKDTQQMPPDIAPNEDGSNESDRRWLDVNHLRRYGYNLSGRMGTCLRHRFGFVKLEKTREAYWSAFYKDRDEIMAAITSSALDDLNAVRNVVIHRAGIADDDFIKERAYSSTI